MNKGNAVSKEERDYSQRIYDLRKQGKIIEATICCEEAMRRYEKSSFFYKINGDLLYEQRRIDESVESYMGFLMRIRSSPELFGVFEKFFRRVTRGRIVKDEVYEQLAVLVGDESFPFSVRKSLVYLLADTYIIPGWMDQTLRRGVDGSSIQALKTDYARISEKSRCMTIVYLFRMSKRPCVSGADWNNRYLLTRLEKAKMYDQGISWAVKMLSYSSDSVIARTLLRLCRKCGDYRAAESYMDSRQMWDTGDFHILYELIRYYDNMDDIDGRNMALLRMETGYGSVVPILGTLEKFYTEFGMDEDAERIRKKCVQMTAQNILTE